MTDEQRVAAAIRVLVRTFLVEGRKGLPAEGRLRFNPLAFQTLNFCKDEGAVRPTALAATMGVPKTTIASVVRKLEGAGLVERTVDAGDHRVRLVRLTDAGHEVVAAIRRQDDRNASAMLAILNGTERSVFLGALERVATAFVEPD